MSEHQSPLQATPYEYAPSDTGLSTVSACDSPQPGSYDRRGAFGRTQA